MKIYSFKKGAGKHVTHFDSNFVMTRIAAIDSSVHIGCMYLDAGGVIGYHEAMVPQLLLIMEGGGNARGSDQVHVPVEKGNAIFWNKGECHEVVSSSGLTAIVVESESLEPEAFMKERNEISKE